MRVRGLTTAAETAAVYIGAVIGAGFASGRELYIFFARYGRTGPLAAVCAGLLLGVGGAVVLGVATRRQVSDYAGLCRSLAGRAGYIIEGLLSLFLFAGIAVMLAAGATVISISTPLSYGWSLLAMASVTILALVFGARGLTAVNSWLVPYLIVVMVAVSLLTALRGPAPARGVSAASSLRLAWSLALYAGYNLITGVAVLVSLPPASARARRAGAVLGGLTLGLLAALGTAAVATRGAAARYLPLPLLTLAGDLGPGWQIAYVPAIFAAILTTAVGDAFALATRLTPGRLWLSGSIAVILALPLANQGFATLVDRGYPLLGLLSLTVFGLAFWRILRTKGR